MSSSKNIYFSLLLLLAACPLLSGCGPTLTSFTHPSADSLEQFAAALDDASPSLRAQIAKVLSEGRQGRSLNTEINAAWQIMHGVICYGRQLEVDTPDHGRVGALDYAFSGGQIDGFELMLGSEPLASTGRLGLKARLEPGSYTGQGHVDQWLAIFAMADLPLDTPIMHAGQNMTLLDWARQSQYDAGHNVLDEFSWTLIAMTHYFPDEPTWLADGGMLSWELLVEAELTYDLDQSPCGGTHRLAGITRALRAKQRLGLVDTPVWQQAQDLVDQCLARAKEQRSADGRLSAQYFSRPGVTADLSAELASSGHVLEFIALAAPQEELSAPWVELAAQRLCEILEQTQRIELDCGGLYHALNGLKIYQQRRWLSK